MALAVLLKASFSKEASLLTLIRELVLCLYRMPSAGRLDGRVDVSARGEVCRVDVRAEVKAGFMKID